MNMNITEDFLQKSSEILETVKNQQTKIRQAAQLFSATILAGRMVHVFGSGHSQIGRAHV